MPKCVGCSKDFAPRGFKAHIKSCRPYKSKKIADVLPKFPDNSVATLELLGVHSEEQGSSGLSNNILFNEVEVNKILVIVQDVFYHVKKSGTSASTNTSTGISKFWIATTEKTATQALSGHIATPTTPSHRPYT